MSKCGIQGKFYIANNCNTMFFEEWQVGYNVFLGVRQLVSLSGSRYVQWQAFQH
jgi:hypothetical protein